MNKVTISAGNRKMGAIPSISLPAITTCRKDAPCFKACYAAKISKLYKNTRDSYDRNYDALINDPDLYWQTIENTLAVNRFFRFHVSGDIPSADYFRKMISLAKKYKSCEILCFTKRWDICDPIIDELKNQKHALPKNLHLLYSAWGKNFQPENPHNLPVVQVIFPEDTVPDTWKICGGNCTECACRGVGCWSLKNGDVLGIYKH